MVTHKWSEAICRPYKSAPRAWHHSWILVEFQYCQHSFTIGFLIFNLKWCHCLHQGQYCFNRQPYLNYLIHLMQLHPPILWNWWRYWFHAKFIFEHFQTWFCTFYDVKWRFLLSEHCLSLYFIMISTLWVIQGITKMYKKDLWSQSFPLFPMLSTYLAKLSLLVGRLLGHTKRFISFIEFVILFAPIYVFI